MKGNQVDSLKLGAEKGVYRVKFGIAYFWIHLVCLAVAGLGLAIFLGADPGWKQYVSALFLIFLSTPLIFLLWRTVPTIFDELRVYENGFTYKSRKGIQTSLWSQIKDHSDILDIGNRLKITSIEKKNKEHITFAYKMRGLDVLFHDLDEYEYSKIPDSEKATAEDEARKPQTLGELKATYHVKGNLFELFPLALLLLVAGFGVIMPIANNNALLIPACSIPMAIPFFVYLWSIVSTRKDELKVFENGFTYQTRKELVSCLWDEIEDYSTVRRSDDISGIKKENGPWISLASNMQGIDDLRPHLRTLVKWTGPEDRDQ